MRKRLDGRIDKAGERLERVEPDPAFRPWRMLEDPSEEELAAFEAEHPNARVVEVRLQEAPEDYPLPISSR